MPGSDGNRAGGMRPGDLAGDGQDAAVVGPGRDPAEAACCEVDDVALSSCCSHTPARRAMPGHCARIVDPEGQDLRPGEADGHQHGCSRAPPLCTPTTAGFGGLRGGWAIISYRARDAPFVGPLAAVADEHRGPEAGEATTARAAATTAMAVIVFLI